MSDDGTDHICRVSLRQYQSDTFTASERVSRTSSLCKYAFSVHVQINMNFSKTALLGAGFSSLCISFLVYRGLARILNGW